MLGIAPDARRDEIEAAFRAQIRRYHPDLNDGRDAGRARDILHAYRTLRVRGQGQVAAPSLRGADTEDYATDGAMRRTAAIAIPIAMAALALPALVGRSDPAASRPAATMPIAVAEAPAPTGEAMVAGRWTASRGQCGAGQVIAFGQDGTWFRAASSGTWALSANRVILLTLEGIPAMRTGDVAAETFKLVRTDELLGAATGGGRRQSLFRCEGSTNRP